MFVSKLFKDKIKNIFFIYAIIFIPMWGLFFINNLIFNDFFNSFGGIHPRDNSITGILEIITSWMFHGGASDANHHVYDHILGNSTALLGLLLIIGLIEKKPIKLIFMLILGSGLATWLIGAPNSIHVGASGLIFAMFGYIIFSVIFGKKWLYIIIIVLMGSQYFYSLKMGLIPQNGISFAAHFGGFISGIIISYIINKKQKCRQITFKEKFNNKIWKIKYYIKNNKLFNKK